MHILIVIVEFAIVLGIMVLVHEFGHFAVAKLCGVRVETFSIGFGPRLFGIVYRGTDYRLSVLPLGGYVKMAGDNDNPAERRLDESIDLHGSDHPHDPAEFNARPRWQRVLIALAGPFANFILSFFLLAFVAKFHHEVDQYLDGPAIVDYVPANTPAAQAGIAPGDTITTFAQDTNPTWQRILADSVLNLNHSVPISWTHEGQLHTSSLFILHQGTGDFDPTDLTTIGLIPEMQPTVGVMQVQPDTPAMHAGLQAGDSITQIDALKLHSVYTLLAYLKDRNGAPTTLHVERNNQPILLQVTPQKLDNGQGDIQYRLGFQNQMPPVKISKLPFGEAIAQSFKDNKDDSTLIVRVIKGMFTRKVSVRSLSGPVGIAQQIDIATQYGYWTVLRLMSTISLNLGIFNLLPIPLLDGGMIVFLLIESLIRRDLNQQIKERVYQAAFVCLILFAAFVIFNDIAKLHVGHP
jgi:regulator of sigma E protease